MNRVKRTRDSTGPSRDGHEFHEAWTSRRAMQLLLPNNGLIGIAVEGLSKEDESRASAATIEIADITIYYGKDAKFTSADRIEIVQFKYSPILADDVFRASHAKKTIRKFAASYIDHKKNYGASDVTKKLFFELITNRPIFSSLLKAIDCIATGRRLSGDIKKQGDQFKLAAGLSGEGLKEFASKCQIKGLAGTLKDTKADLRKIVVDWSATTDARARARLGDIRDMVRRKAGYQEEHRKVVRQVDILDALELSEVEDLLPCPSSLADVGEVVQREQLAEAIALVPSLSKPLLVHAEGGFGKTVFLESLASALSEDNEVVFFDCFGGGAYRSPEDGRHLANRGLVHIANVLACRSLCDPILPGSDNDEMLFSTFRKRLEQCVKALATVSPDRELILFIDAIDNAAEYAKERKQQAFPTQLIESFERSCPVQGVKIMISSRTHRIPIALGDLSYHDFALSPFTIEETNTYLRARLSSITETEVHVAQSRSAGNARILEHLATSDRGLLDPSEIDNPIALDHLLQQRIDNALAEAIRRGYRKDAITAFLAGLSVLPPPVPLEEYAGAHGMETGTIESFAADLAPLLERTQEGMTFRDEPTETLVRRIYGANKQSLKRVAKNLLDRQDQSVYAARALPGLLQRLNDRTKLFRLAFDERFPESIPSTVGRRRIRYARLRAAVIQSASDKDWNKLVQLLVELSGVAASDQKGADFILDNPDLVINANDADALRRLFETRTTWPGSRHARLAIANNLSGATDDASRHFRNAVEWIRHDLQSSEDDFNRARPERLDRAAIPFYLIIQHKPKRAIGFMRHWYDWYGFEIVERVFGLMRYAITRDSTLTSALQGFVVALETDIDCLTGCLSFVELAEEERRNLLTKLSRVCKRKTKLQTSGNHSSKRTYELSDGLRKCAVISASLGMRDEALAISLRAPHERPGLWSYVDKWSDRDTFPFAFRVALLSAIKGVAVQERDLLPKDLLPFVKGIPISASFDHLKDGIKKSINRKLKKDSKIQDPKARTRDSLRSNAEHLLDHRLAPLTELTRALSTFFAAPLRQADKPFRDLINVWVSIRKHKENRYYERQFNPFFQSLGKNAVFFALWARSDLKASSVRALIKRLDEEDHTSPFTLIQLITIINHNRRFDGITSEQAVKAKTQIEHEDDVETRASLYADLARAMLPVSTSEADAYFRSGLEQLDSIGSGDYNFTNELLLFASSIKGQELSEKEFHTLTNICELNMSYDESKFPWGEFGAAMSRISGLRGLAKLSRWHDREKISLEYTLLPYLTALLRDGKISPSYALALNRLAAPVELWEVNTRDLAEALHKQSPLDKQLTTELIRQYEENNPGFASSETAKTLWEISKKVLGGSHSMTKYLSKAHSCFNTLRNDLNSQANYRTSADDRLGILPKEEKSSTDKLKALASATDPLDADSLDSAVTSLQQLALSREEEQVFFDRLRAKVKVNNRISYINKVAHIDALDSYAKFKELTVCKGKWSGSSTALEDAYRNLAMPLLEIHAEEFVSFDRLSGYRFKEVTDLTGVGIPELALHLINQFAKHDWSVPASAWLGLATIVCEKAEDGFAQKALDRLLNSSAAKLTSTVVDGAWRQGMYPVKNDITVSAGLVWQMLGSPRSSDRWLAAHSVCTFARFECWEIIDALVKKLPAYDSKVFQAPELAFYYLHARLWLLIALARIAIDAPRAIAKYQNKLVEITTNVRQPHVSLRHFAARALLACDTAGELRLSSSDRTRLETINESQLPPLNISHRSYGDFYKRRPEDMPEPDFKFHLDYDFNKYEVHSLASAFAVTGWEVQDAMSEEVCKLDDTVTSMYEKGEREIRTSQRGVGITSSMHGYGHYLGWHALLLVAGKLVKTRSAIGNDEGECRWPEWLSYRLLTRSDGFWLSDGMDRPPLDSKVNVLEKGEEGLVLTGDRDKLLALVGITSTKLGADLVVEGDWKSPDKININISSALVPSRQGKARAEQLVGEDPLSVWLPTREYDDEEDYFGSSKEGYEPWIVSPATESDRLDESDPLSVIEVQRRPYFVTKIASQFSLSSGDIFNRTWRLPSRKVAAEADAWGYKMPYEEGESTGVRLVCKTDFLQKVLETNKADLILLIRLHRYESGSNSKFTDTVAVLRIKKSLKFEYFKGAVNKVQQSNW